LKLWFFAKDGTTMIGCVDCGVEFAKRLAQMFNDDQTSKAKIALITDNADPSHAQLRIRFETTKGPSESGPA
jgi:hypothetical protein